MNQTFQTLDHNDGVLSQTRIDIWQFSLNTAASPTEQAWLSNDEQTRANQFYFERHRNRFTCARITLRRILAHYLKQSPQSLHFEYNAQGKPYINHPTLQFNLSHSGDLALLAIGHTYPLGIDLEFFSARPYLGIGKQLFSPEENLALKALPARLRPLAFFHLWSQKEGFIKALGLGLSYPTKRITMPLLPPAHTTFTDPEAHGTWKSISFMPKAACAAAVCFHPDIQTIRYTDRAFT